MRASFFSPINVSVHSFFQVSAIFFLPISSRSPDLFMVYPLEDFRFIEQLFCTYIFFMVLHVLIWFDITI